MTRTRFLAFALLTVASSPALAGASDFALVNGVGTALADVSIRRHGSEEWRNLPVAPANGASSQVQFKDDDCAFDIRAKVDGKVATWSGINLCETKSVKLNRNASGEVWVDYD